MTVQAVLHAALYSLEETSEDNFLHEMWSAGICSCLPESEMRSQVVLSALMEKIKQPAMMHWDTLSKLVELIKSATRSRFVHSGVLEGISSIFEEAETPKEAFIKVYVQLAEIDTGDSVSRHLFTISGLLRKPEFPRMDLQMVMYEGIDRLKRRLPQSIYRDNLLSVQ
ncbi:hypothetical protein CLOM_g8659 [Closterium sp. NIES-68]|nr:hypothetical protein CLOM_g16633 [Closterium sp. NIES-68]GJP49459.1 hypothetical protein CLOM_g8659 [Closterium sp. NIES-68]GJP69032.1 hypothetical protein CLOP_g25660 [Closterium sp. NIES-67]